PTGRQGDTRPGDLFGADRRKAMTLEQKRASMAFDHLKEVTDEKDRKVYGGMARKLPAQIRSAGMVKGLHFVKSRKKGPLNSLRNHLGQQLTRIDSKNKDMGALCD